MTIKQIYNKTLSAFEGIDNGENEALWTVMQILDISKTDLHIHPEKEVADCLLDKCLDVAKKRKEGIPLYYILGSCEFYGFPFKVGEGVLIPRGDTEILVDCALEILKGKDNPKVLDLCAGSGAISIPIASLTNASVTAIEKYDEAFYYLTENIKLNNADVDAVKRDALSYIPDTEFDIICSNPPYIAYSEKASLDREVLREPDTALFAEEDGLYFYRVFLENFDACPPKNILFEIGNTQGNAVSEMMRAKGYSDIRIIKDFGGNDRVVAATYKK